MRGRRASLETVYDLVSGDEGARVCKDISEDACRVVPGNFFRQLAAQILTKLGDSLSDPKLVLTWLLVTIGTPAAAIGLLVPVREAGSLLPQLAIGGAIRVRPVRKWFWVGGSAVQGAAVLTMALIAALDPGPGAGWAVLGLLVVFSAARAVCSISSKDLLGKTVPRTRRGRLGGLASTAAGMITLGAGLFFAAYDPDEFGAGGFAILLTIAGALWMAAAALMAGLAEKPGATSGAGNALAEAVRSVRFLLTDREFRNFCAARALMAGTILSMPFYVLLAQEATGGKLAGLGVLLIASSSATAVSAAVWGWMADRSSRGALAVAGMLAGSIGLLTFLVSGIGLEGRGALWMYGGLFFLIGIAHTGIRVGRKTYLVDMAPSDRRASYVAVSNTLIGVVLLLSGAIGFLAPVVGARGVVLIFALLGFSGGLLAWLLREPGDGVRRG